MGPARRDSVPEILEPAIGDLARELAGARRRSDEVPLGGRNASGEIVLRRVEGFADREDTVPGLLARGSGPVIGALEIEPSAKVEVNPDMQLEVVDDLLLDPWFFKTEEEIAAIEDDPTAKIIEIRIAPVLDQSVFAEDRWGF